MKKVQSPKSKVQSLNESLPTVVTDLSALEAFCAEPLQVSSHIRGRVFHFTGRRLKPAEARQVQLLIEKALPPIVREEGKEPRYDLENKDYLKSKEDYRRQARALALWLGFPCFRFQAGIEAKVQTPPPKVPEGPELIAAWIESRQLEDDTLEALFQSLMRSEVESYLGFTSGNSSPKS